jgi:hypothetical protein
MHVIASQFRSQNQPRFGSVMRALRGPFESGADTASAPRGLHKFPLHVRLHVPSGPEMLFLVRLGKTGNNTGRK